MGFIQYVHVFIVVQLENYDLENTTTTPNATKCIIFIMWDLPSNCAESNLLFLLFFRAFLQYTDTE
jgi:hypothetical protein